MQDDQRPRLSFTQTGLPWVVGAVALCLYLITMSRWVTLDSLPYVAKVTGWDWTLPVQSPLFYLVTFPFRWLPESWQPLALNLFSAGCSALALTLLARSVALLPHDRTHDQRQRERSEFSLLSIRASWIPPVFAALVCGLELTFWEHSTAATGESLDLLVFAYVIRCLLEFRIDPRDSWLTRMALVYGLGVTNSFAMIGFFPCVLVAVLWIKGRSFFEFQFIARMIGFGLLGLLLYFLLPVAWALSHSPTVGFWEALRAHLGAQKAMLFNTPYLRSRVLILSLTSVLPLLVAGVRWPASFGDTSAAGAAMSSAMFRIVHAVFLAACVWVAFDQQFSPRSLAFGRPFLSFYYLGALSIGYFTGYILLVFGEGRVKSWHRRSGFQLVFNRLAIMAVWLAFLAVPVGLLARNWNSVRATNGPLLRQFTEQSVGHLPAKGGFVLSDDAYGLLLLSAGLSQDNLRNKYVLVHTRSLLSSSYHQELHKHYPERFPNFFTNQPPDEVIDDGSLLQLITYLSVSNSVSYLHPSFGYYFERFYLRPHGVVYELNLYPTNSIFPPALTAPDLAENRSFWTNLNPSLTQLTSSSRTDSREAHYLARYYSRALNYWGVALQRNSSIVEAGNAFHLAVELNTNNIPAETNFEFNRTLRTGQPRVPETTKSIEEKFGFYRGWEPMLMDNGPFDQPDYCLQLAQIFGSQNLYRQSAIQFDRVRTLETNNLVASAGLADVFLRASLPTRAIEEVNAVRAQQKTNALPVEIDLELARIEASAQFSLQHTAQAEAIIRTAYAKYPSNPAILDTLLQILAQSDRLPEAIATSQTIINADPTRVQSFINQAALFYRNKERDKAIQSLDNVLQKSPQQPQALLYKIFLLIDAKEFDKARTAVDALLNVEPDNLEALLYKGVVEIETKSFAGALEPLTKVLKRQANNANARRNRAVAYLQLNDLDNAEKDYDTLRRFVSRDFVFVAYYGLGEIAFRRHDLENARKFYKLYLENAPADLKEERAAVTKRLQELDQAKR